MNAQATPEIREPEPVCRILSRQNPASRFAIKIYRYETLYPLHDTLPERPLRQCERREGAGHE
jgi:hypothetical protein